jgi:hypothetical protein
VGSSFVDSDGVTRFTGEIVGRPVFAQETDPGDGANPGNGALWVDTSQSPPLLFLRDGDGSNDDGAAWLIYQRLGAGTVLTAMIADGAVTAAKIADLAVLNAKIGHDSVDADKIVDGSVSNSKIVSRTITASRLDVPNADPHVLGVIWDDAGTLKASQG